MTNKKKKSKFLFIIFILAFAYACFYYSNNKMNHGTKNEVEKTVDSYFKDLKAGNFNNSNIKDNDFKKLTGEILSKVDYEIEDVSIKDSLATVKLKIDTIDIMGIYNKYSSELNPIVKKYISGDEKQKAEAVKEIKANLYEKVGNDIKNGDYKKIQGKTKINLVLKDGKWVVDTGDQLINYITGKLSSIINLL